MQPLSAAFDVQHHQVYFRHLDEALTGPDRSRFRNIALSGSYGSGKSSVLDEVTRRHPDTTVCISLSTLGDVDAEVTDGTASAALRSSTTNRIQKEIVKQLLYREDPFVVRESRFRRIATFRWRRQIRTAAAVGAAALLMTYVSGFATPLADLAGDNRGLRPGIYGLLFLAFTAAALGVAYAFHNRISIEKLGTGPATIALSGTSASYFDQYLDEIVYFFEATRCDIVILEDIDRFDEPRIFETLKELNTILNNSKHLTSRPIRFIYAIKDSIFEELGTDTHALPSRDNCAAGSNVAQANRTKFFDLVIPIVPFLTHQNARDVFAKTMDANHDVDGDLIDLAGRYITDMRMILNIRNEFVVFKEQLIASRDAAIPGLTDTTLFALIVYKCTSMGDFEKIKEGTSALDSIYNASRDLVTRQVSALNSERIGIARRLQESDPIAQRSQDLGDALEAHARRVLVALQQRRGTAMTVTTPARSGADVSYLRTPEFWRELLTAPDNWVRFDMPISPGGLTANRDYLEAILGTALSEEDWREEQEQALTGRLDDIEELLTFLRTADMGALYHRRELTIAEPGGESQCFADVVALHLHSKLAIQLVAHGFIDRNFTLYVSQYYGVRVSPAALNFLVHVVQPDRSEPTTELTPAEVEMVLREAGASMPSDRSMFNVSIVDYLLDASDGRIDPVLTQLMQWSGDEITFVELFLALGRNGGMLFERSAGRWPRVFTALAALNVDAATRLHLYSCALLGARPLRYDTAPEVAEAIAGSSDSLAALTTDATEQQAERVVHALDRLGVTLPQLRPLSQPVKIGVVNAHLYLLTEDNLCAALDDRVGLALDSLLDHNQEVFAYVMTDLPAYMDIVKSSAGQHVTVAEAGRFSAIIEQVAAIDPDLVCEIANHAHSECSIAALGELSVAAWPGIVRAGRFAFNFDNVETYVAEYGVDNDLADALRRKGTILSCDSIDEDRKYDVAVKIVGAQQSLDAATRVHLIRSLGMTATFGLDDVPPEAGVLYGLLLEHELIADDASTFTTIAELGWPTIESAINVSPTFADIANPSTLPSHDLAAFFASQTITESVRSAVLARLSEWGQIERRAATAAAAFAQRHGRTVTPAGLSHLAANGAPAELILGLLRYNLGVLSAADLTAVMAALGQPYSALTEIGRSDVVIPKSDDLKAVVLRMKQLNLVASYKADGTTYKVRLHQSS